MGLFQISGIKLLSVGAAIPSTKEHNRDLTILPESERNEIIEKVGIGSRRLASPAICASDLCIAAANAVLEKTQVSPASIGILVFVTQTPDYILPGNSMLAQQKLNLSSSTLLIDLNQGCAGYIYGMSVLASLLQSTNLEYGLLLVGDTITRLLSSMDRTTVPIFSDAGTATLMRRDNGSSKMYFNIGADSKGFNAIHVKDGGSRYPFRQESLCLKELSPGIKRADIHLVMEGLDVLNFSLKNVVPNIRELMNYGNVNSLNVNYFILHQANRILNENILKKLDVDHTKAPETLSVFGNTSSATIPLTIAYRLGKILNQSNCLMLLSGFGAGFSWGSALVPGDSIQIPEIIEI